MITVAVRLPYLTSLRLKGVYANHTVALYVILGSDFFRVWGVIFSGVAIIAWLAVFSRTAVLVWNGKIFNPPLLDDIEDITIVEMKKGSSMDIRRESCNSC